MISKKLLIGLTGAIGSGKSRVTDYFAARGASTIKADQIVRDLLEPGKEGWVAMEKVFSNRFFNDDQTVDRQRLRSAIFSDPELRRMVDHLIHPLVRAEVERICAEQSLNNRLIVVEVPLLFEVGWQNDFDLTIVVEAAVSTCLDRIMIRDGVSRQDAEKAMAVQMDIADKVALADHVIDNNGDWQYTASQVDELISKLTGG